MEDIFLDEMLEDVNGCPVCNAVSRELFVSTQDYIYGSSSRVWGYFRCRGCGSLYLGRRPRSDYIYKAYGSYHTHDVGKGMSGGGVKSLVEIYLKNSKCGLILRAVATLFFPVRLFLDAKSRGLRYISQGKVFDYGCGNGDFLHLCTLRGLAAYGADFDIEAVKQARKSGASVEQGGIDVLRRFPGAEFDLVTISHVIEHVYDVNELIEECYRVLKPGGRLWLETPNAMAKGLQVYKEYWRGLESPRHIFLLSRNALVSKVLEHGFCDVEEEYHFLSALYMYVVSARLKGQVGWGVIIKALAQDLVGILLKKRSEFITLKCRKKF